MAIRGYQVRGSTLAGFQVACKRIRYAAASRLFFLSFTYRIISIGLIASYSSLSGSNQWSHVFVLHGVVGRTLQHHRGSDGSACTCTRRKMKERGKAQFQSVGTESVPVFGRLNMVQNMEYNCWNYSYILPAILENLTPFPELAC